MSAVPFDTSSAASGLPVPTTAPGAPVPVARGLQMKRRNPVGVWLGLPLITLGIYTLVWLYKIHSELGMFDRRRIVGATGPVLAWIFGVVTLMIWPLVSTYNTGQTIAAAQRSAGLLPTCSGGLGVVLVFLFGLHPLYYQVQLNKIIAVNGVPEGAEVPLYV
jgi:phosphotransferase system  glucose/maltose/N-acetylglucosamine-specific IIC component